MDSIILAFNVGVDKDAEDAVFASSIKIIKSEIIYKLVDDCVATREGMKLNRAKAIEERITLPFQIEVLPHACFRASHPAIFGVRVVAGRVKLGAYAMSDEGVPVGKIRGIQNEKTPMTMAKANDEVAISMDEPTFGRQVKEGQMLYSKLSLEDIKMLQGEMAYLINDEEKELVKKIVGMGGGHKK
jgi:Translation initiation factor 2 (IF-2; GTPase)